MKSSRELAWSLLLLGVLLYGVTVRLDALGLHGTRAQRAPALRYAEALEGELREAERSCTVETALSERCARSLEALGERLAR